MQQHAPLEARSARTAGPDVVIIGGGPGGSVCAAQLARSGLSVILLEKDVFPRFHLGESLLPESLRELETIGVLDRVREAFLPKYGARFHDDIHHRKERFSFATAWKAEPIHAYQVPRDTFDAILLDHARTCGVDVRESTTVSRILTDDTGRARGVLATAADGSAMQVDARFVVDASGRDTLRARADVSTTKIDGLDQTALYAQFENVPRQGELFEGDIDIVLFSSIDPGRPNWFWFIPFKDGRTSVGAVVSRAWIRERRATLGADPTRLFEAAVAESATATNLLANARRLWPEARATADFSYRVTAITGSGWLAVGDAGGFIDPLFSTGAHLAMAGGRRAADAIVLALASPAQEAALFAAWEANLRGAAETFILAVRSFYAGPLVDLIFTEDKHQVLRRSITSLLAGDVFGDAIWLRDTRRRLRELLASSALPATA